MRPANSRLSAPIETARANRIATEVKTGLKRPKKLAAPGHWGTESPVDKTGKRKENGFVRV